MPLPSCKSKPDSCEPRGRVPRRDRRAAGLLLMLAVWLLSTTGTLAGEAYILGLGDLPGDRFHSLPGDVSADGTIVVGSSDSANGREAFVWTAETGMIGLGDFADGLFPSGASRVAADGRTVVGAEFANGTLRPYRWTSQSGVRGIPTGEVTNAGAVGVSADGRVVVGGGSIGFFRAGYRWVSGVGATTLPRAPDMFNLDPTGLSADGQVVVGTVFSGNRAFRWSADTGTVLLPTVTPVDSTYGPESGAGFISPDGQVIYGHQRTGPGNTIMRGRWHADGRFDFLADNLNFSDCSYDGAIAVGKVTGMGFGNAMVYDDANGARLLRHVLPDDYGVDLTGWQLGSALAVSWDGRMIAGNGPSPNTTAPDDGYEAYLIRLPLPGDTYADISGDSRVSIADVKPFTNCMKGPGVPAWGTCRAADLDFDGDVDLRDFVRRLQPLAADPCPMGDLSASCTIDPEDLPPFLACLTGPLRIAPPTDGEPHPQLSAECAPADLDGSDSVDLRDVVLLQRTLEPTAP